MNVDLSTFLPYYRSWATNALQRQQYDAELVRDLERVRDDHKVMVLFYSDILKKYESSDLREDQKERLKAWSDGKDYCAHIVTTSNKIIDYLNSFKV